MDEKAALVEIGLSENEASVYLALLKSGTCGAGELAARSGIYRRTVYDTLETLLEKGLAGFIDHGGRKQFRASPPAQIGAMLDEKKAIFNSIVPELNRVSFDEKKTRVVMLQGRRALRSILSEIIDTGETFYAFGGQMKILDVLGSSFDIFPDLMRARKIHQMGIYLDTPDIRAKVKRWSFVNARFIDPTNASDVSWWVYGNNVVYILWKKEPEIVKITSAEYVKSYKKSFKIAWKSARP